VQSVALDEVEVEARIGPWSPEQLCGDLGFQLSLLGNWEGWLDVCAPAQQNDCVVFPILDFVAVVGSGFEPPVSYPPGDGRGVKEKYECAGKCMP
jgi:hypothetical protein